MIHFNKCAENAFFSHLGGGVTWTLFYVWNVMGISMINFNQCINLVPNRKNELFSHLFGQWLGYFFKFQMSFRRYIDVWCLIFPKNLKTVTRHPFKNQQKVRFLFYPDIYKINWCLSSNISKNLKMPYHPSKNEQMSAFRFIQTFIR